MSQSIKSDRISESTVARIAGNILSGMVGQTGRRDPAVHFPDDEMAVDGDRKFVARAVGLARAIAAEVERTRPVVDSGQPAQAAPPMDERDCAGTADVPQKTPATWSISQTSGGFRADCTCGWSASAHYQRIAKEAAKTHWRTFHFMPQAGQP